MPAIPTISTPTSFHPIVNNATLVSCTPLVTVTSIAAMNLCHFDLNCCNVSQSHIMPVSHIFMLLYIRRYLFYIALCLRCSFNLERSCHVCSETTLLQAVTVYWQRHSVCTDSVRSRPRSTSWYFKTEKGCLLGHQAWLSTVPSKAKTSKDKASGLHFDLLGQIRVAEKTTC